MCLCILGECAVFVLQLQDERYVRKLGSLLFPFYNCRKIEVIEVSMAGSKKFCTLQESYRLQHVVGYIQVNHLSGGAKYTRELHSELQAYQL